MFLSGFFHTMSRGVSRGFHSVARAVRHTAYTISRPVMRVVNRVTRPIRRAVRWTGHQAISAYHTVVSIPKTIQTGISTVYRDVKEGASNIIAIPKQVISAAEHSVIHGEDKLASVMSSPVLWLAGAAALMVLTQRR